MDMALSNTEFDVSSAIDCNINDPADLHKLQLELESYCQAAENNENFISEENAKQLSSYIINPKIWPSVMFSMPSLTVKTSLVPEEGGGARGILQRALRDAQLLKNDEPEAQPDQRHRINRNILEHRLLSLFGSQHQETIRQFAKDVYQIDGDTASEVRQASEEMLSTTVAEGEAEEPSPQGDWKESMSDVEDNALRDRFLSKMITTLGPSHREAVERFVQGIYGEAV